MSYKQATRVLPPELVKMVQEYVDGEFLYIPRVSANRKSWGEATSTRRELGQRNALILADYLAGTPVNALANKYFLSPKSIQRIICRAKQQQAL